jgi:hypothetical protein
VGSHLKKILIDRASLLVGRGAAGGGGRANLLFLMFESMFNVCTRREDDAKMERQVNPPVKSL